MRGGTMIKVENFAAIVVLLIATVVPILMVHSGAAHQQLPAAAAGAEADLDYPVLSGTSSLVGSSLNLVDHGPAESRGVTNSTSAATGGIILMRRSGGRRLMSSCWLGYNGCASNLTCCNNVDCVNTTSDGKHCGACNRSCAWDKICCNGVCTNIWSADASNCGACGKWCGWKGATCHYGICNYNSA